MYDDDVSTNMLLLDENKDNLIEGVDRWTFELVDGLLSDTGLATIPVQSGGTKELIPQQKKLH